MSIANNCVIWISQVVEAKCPPDKIDNFFEAVKQMEDDGQTKEDILTWMVGALYDGLKKGNWPR